MGMEAKQLKPCPFCGAPAFLWRTNWDTIIECSRYHIDTHRIQVCGKSYEEAAERWNTRSDGQKEATPWNLES